MAENDVSLLFPFGPRLSAPELLIPGREPVGQIQPDFEHPHLYRCVAWWPMIPQFIGSAGNLDVIQRLWTSFGTGITPTGIKAGKQTISFDGTVNALIDAGDHLPYEVLTDDWAIEVWVWPASGGDIDYTLVCNGAIITTDEGYKLSMTTGGGIELEFSDGVTRPVSDLGGTINLNEWNHVLATWDRDGDYNVYINGAEAFSGTVTNTNDINAPDPLAIGSRPGGVRTLDGAMQNVRLFRRYITFAEALDHFYNPWAAMIPVSE